MLQTRITKAVIKIKTAARKGYERLEPDVIKVASPVLEEGGRVIVLSYSAPKIHRKGYHLA